MQTIARYVYNQDVAYSYSPSQFSTRRLTFACSLAGMSWPIFFTVRYSRTHTPKERETIYIETAMGREKSSIFYIFLFWDVFAIFTDLAINENVTAKCSLFKSFVRIPKFYYAGRMKRKCTSQIFIGNYFQ